MKESFQNIIDKLEATKDLTDDELKIILELDENTYPNSLDTLLIQRADTVRKNVYQDEVYIRGLIEFTNYCKNNCYYCGIRCGNTKVDRYRLTREDILLCCKEGYNLGFRTFVLQGGEDHFYTDDIICDIVGAIRDAHPDCAITLSIGERSKESYKAYFNAGANRYLLRHETANAHHYSKLHPESMSLENRKRCLFDLKDIGYQVGSGFMVGSPY
ncbi:MAG: [FeFe] hydrogenase H-cluster radical SAM maturase HydE, partial [Lachnospiraceae bacterium]|nr:[FeFe] hydrogenase H-cluster radical SAM maturase HydE [Lachnospiraceae bacterium]